MRKLVLLASFAMLAILSNPARAQFCPGVSPWVFDDVLTSDPFCGDITWMAQNGVSLGCQIIDANHRLYCPAADVPRNQMAALIYRLAHQPDSKSLEIGTITKPGGSFLHNYGNGNTFAGLNAGNFSMTGSMNAAFGLQALESNAAANANTAMGAGALKHTTDAGFNTAVGAFALSLNTSGENNTAGGAHALFSNTGGGGNTAVGAGSLTSNLLGNTNVAIGSSALYTNTTGGGNTAVGTAALGLNTSGSDNIVIGQGAGLQITTGSNNIHIGNPGLPGDDSTIRLGALGTQTRTFITAIRGVTTASNDAVGVVIDSNGQLGTISSSRYAKDDIADMSDSSVGLMQLRPVTFHYKADRDPAGPRLQYGLIAEEVAEVYPGMVATKDGKPETVMYQYLAPMLLNEFQKQQRTIEDQAREIRTQRSEIADLKRAVEVLMARTASDSRLAAH
jgi:hypothetical protein